MRHLRFSLVAIFAGMLSAPAFGADVNRKIIAELDPVAPASASYEERTNDVTTSKWGGNVDFNVAGVLSTGPEFWTGTFAAKGPDEDGETFRREDMWPGERHKLDAIRLRWMISKWEQPASMRGWFVKAGYSYTRINSRGNRYNEEQGEGDAIPAGIFSATPDDQTDLVTDIRHGIALGFGNRWALVDQRLTLNLGASFTANFKRSVTVDALDPNARADYDDMIETLADTRMTTRPTPEINIGVGYAW